jgi:hypothetical protein
MKLPQPYKALDDALCRNTTKHYQDVDGFAHHMYIGMLGGPGCMFNMAIAVSIPPQIICSINAFGPFAAGFPLYDSTISGKESSRQSDGTVAEKKGTYFSKQASKLFRPALFLGGLFHLGAAGLEVVSSIYDGRPTDFEWLKLTSATAYGNFAVSQAMYLLDKNSKLLEKESAWNKLKSGAKSRLEKLLEPTPQLEPIPVHNFSPSII